MIKTPITGRERNGKLPTSAGMSPPTVGENEEAQHARRRRRQQQARLDEEESNPKKLRKTKDSESRNILPMGGSTHNVADNLRELSVLGRKQAQGTIETGTSNHPSQRQAFPLHDFTYPERPEAVPGRDQEDTIHLSEINRIAASERPTKSSDGAAGDDDEESHTPLASGSETAVASSSSDLGNFEVLVSTASKLEKDRALNAMYSRRKRQRKKAFVHDLMVSKVRLEEENQKAKQNNKLLQKLLSEANTMISVYEAGRASGGRCTPFQDGVMDSQLQAPTNPSIDWSDHARLMVPRQQEIATLRCQQGMVTNPMLTPSFCGLGTNALLQGTVPFPPLHPPPVLLTMPLAGGALPGAWQTQIPWQQKLISSLPTNLTSDGTQEIFQDRLFSGKISSGLSRTIRKRKSTDPGSVALQADCNLPPSFRHA